MTKSAKKKKFDYVDLWSFESLQAENSQVIEKMIQKNNILKFDSFIGCKDVKILANTKIEFIKLILSKKFKNSPITESNQTF